MNDYQLKVDGTLVETLYNEEEALSKAEKLLEYRKESVFVYLNGKPFRRFLNKQDIARLEYFGIIDWG